MSEYIIIFLIVLAIIAAILRADFVLILIYILLGVYTVGRWWSQRALKAVSVSRTFNHRAFLGEKVQVFLEIANSGRLPVVWLQLHESLPTALSLAGSFQQVVSLGPGERMKFEYLLMGRKRGYYDVGPLKLYSGDIFGLSAERERLMQGDHLIVYPKIIPLTKVSLPSHSPLGTLRHKQPIFEDPTRVLGKRDYVAGDSLRRVDWKATATTGRMQVKIFEPSIALETAIFLNLNVSEYSYRTRFDVTELGIIVAASLANWVTGMRQSIGLNTNGIDPLQEDAYSQPVPPRHGRAHLMRILDVLARIQAAETFPFVQLLHQQVVHLSWGTTLIVITPQIDDDLFDALFQARRAGLNAILVPCGPVAGLSELRQRAKYFGFPLFHILRERDLDIWRQ
jgi:uncharacterized protein (DUF58 family)